MTRYDGAIPAPSIERLDLLLSFEPVVADHVQPSRQIEFMRLLTAVFIYVGAIIRYDSIERAPQRQITTVQHFSILSGLLSPDFPRSFCGGCLARIAPTLSPQMYKANTASPARDFHSWGGRMGERWSRETRSSRGEHFHEP